MGLVSFDGIVARKGRMPSEIRHHLRHLSGIDGGVIPPHAVARLTDEPTNNTVRHASHELDPGALTLSKFNAGTGGVVEELIVADPKGSIPGFVVCESVHEVRCFQPL